MDTINKPGAPLSYVEAMIQLARSRDPHPCDFADIVCYGPFIDMYYESTTHDPRKWLNHLPQKGRE